MFFSLLPSGVAPVFPTTFPDQLSGGILRPMILFFLYVSPPPDLFLIFMTALAAVILGRRVCFSVREGGSGSSFLLPWDRGRSDERDVG